MTRPGGVRPLTGVALICLLVCSTSLAERAWGQRRPGDPVHDFVLVGVVVGRADGPMAALRDSRTGRETWYRVGDRIEDVTLSAISSDRVILQHAERDIELRLAASQRGGDGRVGAAPPGRPVRGRAVPATAPTLRPPNR